MNFHSAVCTAPPSTHTYTWCMKNFHLVNAESALYYKKCRNEHLNWKESTGNYWNDLYLLLAWGFLWGYVLINGGWTFLGSTYTHFYRSNTGSIEICHYCSWLSLYILRILPLKTTVTAWLYLPKFASTSWRGETFPSTICNICFSNMKTE